MQDRGRGATGRVLAALPGQPRGEDGGAPVSDPWGQKPALTHHQGLVVAVGASAARSSGGGGDYSGLESLWTDQDSVTPTTERGSSGVEAAGWGASMEPFIEMGGYETASWRPRRLLFSPPPSLSLPV